ncbi:hypothetical protein KF840_18575 [bacterium]|nr:hypothetical protein [bacterium]
MPVAVALLAACSGSVLTSKFPRLGAPTLAPTDPAQVEVLRRHPVRPYVRLGKIRATPRGGASAQQVETALRQAAASMGADALVFERDGEGDAGPFVEYRAIAYRAP